MCGIWRAPFLGQELQEPARTQLKATTCGQMVPEPIAMLKRHRESTCQTAHGRRDQPQRLQSSHQERTHLEPEEEPQELEAMAAEALAAVVALVVGSRRRPIRYWHWRAWGSFIR